MIELYTWKTPNGRKPAILLEELALPYRAIPVDISADRQFAPDFLAIAPNNKIPAIVDPDAPGGPLSLFESGAILTYLAEREGRLLASGGASRYRALEWLNWQMGGLGPMFGQLGYFSRRAPEVLPLAIGRFTEESARLLGVLERRLGAEPFLAGADYSVADIAVYPWMVTAKTMLAEPLADTLAGKPAIDDWMERLAARPAVAKGMRVLED